jgi:hypothetical protein
MRWLSVALALAVVCGAAWAKASRYDEHALPSPHFSTSVKIARALFYDGPRDEARALMATRAHVPEPDWNGPAPAVVSVESTGNLPLLFQALRAPPFLA